MKGIKRELGVGFLAGFVMVAFLLTSAILAFAQESRAEKGYTYNLKALIEQAEKNIKKVDEGLKKKEIEKRNQQREAETREHFERGNALYKEGRLKEAKKEWQKALEITKDPEMKDYIKDSERRAREKELTRKQEERTRQKRLEAERREKEQLEQEKQRQLERQKKEEERRQKEEIRKQKEEQEKFEKERIKKSKKAVQDAKEMAKDTEEETKLRLKDLTYKTERECLDALGKYPDDKKAFDNLVKLYLLRDELLNRAKELHKNKDYQGAIQEYNKVLLIEPENKKAKMGIRRTRSEMK